MTALVSLPIRTGKEAGKFRVIAVGSGDRTLSMPLSSNGQEQELVRADVTVAPYTHEVKKTH